MHIFVIFLAWAVVSGASAWSSSEVSCGSCGSECQKACGTRNFRACCFNFQRRRRSQTPNYSNLRGLDNSDSVDFRSLRLAPERGLEPQIPKILRYISQHGENYLKSPTLHKDYQLYRSTFPAYLQESSEEEVDDEVSDLPSSHSVVEGRSPLAFEGTGDTEVEEEAFNRLVEMAYRHPPQTALQRQIRQARYHQSPSKIRK